MGRETSSGGKVTKEVSAFPPVVPLPEGERRLRWKTPPVSYCDCRHVCDDEESHHEDLDERDHVHEDNDDHCSASGSEACLVIFSFHSVQLDCVQGVRRSLCCRCLFPKARPKSIFRLPFCQNLPCRITNILGRACAFGTSRPRGSAPRLFRKSNFLRNLSNLLLS